MSECLHSWCYENMIYTSNPPQRNKICRKCGLMERETGHYIDCNEYENLVKQFRIK